MLLSYRMPREPSTPRIGVWRKLRSLGVAQLGDGLVALPEDARTREQLEWVAGDVEAAHGSAVLWLAAMLTQADEQRLVAQLAAARAEEYRALLAQAEAADTAHPLETRRLVGQLRRELRKIRRRDYFPPPEADVARRTVEGLASAAQLTGSGPA